jgi:hypothetical protein
MDLYDSDYGPTPRPWPPYVPSEGDGYVPPNETTWINWFVYVPLTSIALVAATILFYWNIGLIP